jgi:S1-C subfamily serine protease
MKSLIYATVAGMALASTGTALAQDQFATTAEQVNKKMVKLFGSGGFKGLASYGTGLVISPDGHVLTVASHLLDTQSLRVHLYDGRRFDNVKTIVTEPVLDLAILKIEGVKDLPYCKPAPATGCSVFLTSSRSPPAMNRCRFSAASSRPIPSCMAGAASTKRPIPATSTSSMPS